MFCWIPSHVGIHSNKQANAAANTASQHLNIPIPVSDIQSAGKRITIKKWQKQWARQEDNYYKKKDTFFPLANIKF